MAMRASEVEPLWLEEGEIAFLAGRIRLGGRRPLRELSGYAATFFCLCVLFAGMGLLKPSHDHVGTHQQLGFPPCSFRAIFGLPCPGCGGTTAVCWMVHGRPDEALRSSIFGTAVFLGLAAVWAACGLSLILRRPVRLVLEGPDAARVIAYAVVLMLASWVVKIVDSLAHPPGMPT